MPPVIRQRRKEERPQELLSAALELFVEKGFAATRAEEVAARAGVSKGTLYLYYPSKEELLKAVIRHHLSSQIQARSAEVSHHEGPSADLLRDALSQWWTAVYDSPASGVFKLIITEVRNFPEIAEFYRHEVIEPGQSLVEAIIRRGIGRGEFRAVDVPAAMYSLVLPMVMVCLHKHSLGACGSAEPLLDAHRFIRQHLDFMVRALQTGEPAATPPQPRRRR